MADSAALCVYGLRFDTDTVKTESGVISVLALTRRYDAVVPTHNFHIDFSCGSDTVAGGGETNNEQPPGRAQTKSKTIAR